MTKLLLTTAFLTIAATPAMAQSNAPQPISKTNFMQRIDQNFVGADANKDGFADRAELEAVEAKSMAARGGAASQPGSGLPPAR